MDNQKIASELVKVAERIADCKIRKAVYPPKGGWFFQDLQDIGEQLAKKLRGKYKRASWSNGFIIAFDHEYVSEFDEHEEESYELEVSFLGSKIEYTVNWIDGFSRSEVNYVRVNGVDPTDPDEALQKLTKSVLKKLDEYFDI